jgi:hypothetical protein
LFNVPVGQEQGKCRLQPCRNREAPRRERQAPRVRVFIDAQMIISEHLRAEESSPLAQNVKQPDALENFTDPGCWPRNLQHAVCLGGHVVRADQFADAPCVDFRDPA